MKFKIFVIIILLALTGCATAPNSSVQNTLQKQGAIKIGENFSPVMSMLAAMGDSMTYMPFWITQGRKYIVLFPKSYNFDTNYYGAEPLTPSTKPRYGLDWGFKPEDYKLTNIWKDRVQVWDYYINLGKKIGADSKEINWLYKQKANTMSNPAYVQWKNRGNKVVKVAKTKPKTNTKKTETVSRGSSGSAFFVTSKGHIITNYHVVKNCRSEPKIKFKNKDVETKVIARDTALDLGLLKANLRNTTYISLSDEQPQKLQRIIASGYPFGKYISDDLKFTSGIVSSLKGPGDDSTLVQVDAALNPGNSGGPIVDEETGELVAVSVMGMKKSISEGQNFGIKASSVKNFLETNKVKTPISWFNSSDIAKLLEETTLYTFCR